MTLENYAKCLLFNELITLNIRYLTNTLRQILLFNEQIKLNVCHLTN